MKRIGIIAAQGDVSEHILAVNAAFAELGDRGEGVAVRSPSGLSAVHAVILPGGESTAISRLLVKFGLHDALVERVNQGMPIMGTCAGAILLASRGDGDVARTRTVLLGLMDMTVNRNAFGRQRESFQASVSIHGMDRSFEAVFIRAPAIMEVGKGCIPLARVEDRIIMARQGSRFALTFHPELTGDTRIHALLINEI